MTIEITENDVGRKVRHRDDRVSEITKWYYQEPDDQILVRTSLCHWFTPSGQFGGFGPAHPLDIIEFVEEETKPMKHVIYNEQSSEDVIEWRLVEGDEGVYLQARKQGDEDWWSVMIVNETGYRFWGKGVLEGQLGLKPK